MLDTPPLCMGASSASACDYPSKARRSPAEQHAACAGIYDINMCTCHASLLVCGAMGLQRLTAAHLLPVPACSCFQTLVLAAPAPGVLAVSPPIAMDDIGPSIRQVRSRETAAAPHAQATQRARIS